MVKYKLWTELPYAGENQKPKNPEDPYAGSWKMFFFKRSKNSFIDLNGKIIKLNIKNPNTVDWNNQLKQVQNSIKFTDPHKITVANYWGNGVATKQWVPIIDKLVDTYGASPPMAARILANVQATINDGLVITWYLKFKWLVPRPNQLDNKLATFLCTPRHPSYPSGHATIAAAAATILGYYFPAEKGKLEALAKECAISRLYAGVHFPIDNSEGLKLGRQIGSTAIRHIKTQKNSRSQVIDKPFKVNKNAILIPPPYVQAIPYLFSDECQSLVIR